MDFGNGALDTMQFIQRVIRRWRGYCTGHIQWVGGDERVIVEMCRKCVMRGNILVRSQTGWGWHILYCRGVNESRRMDFNTVDTGLHWCWLILRRLSFLYTNPHHQPVKELSRFWSMYGHCGWTEVIYQSTTVQLPCSKNFPSISAAFYRSLPTVRIQ